MVKLIALSKAGVLDTTTVIIPVYRVEPYLHRCLDSVLGQTYTDFELVLVDDGSPDGCGAICDEYAAAEDRALVVHQPNGGLSSARNAGIDWAMACSDSMWLAFVDSDDWVHPRYLEYLHCAAEEHRAKVAVCGYLVGRTRESHCELRLEGDSGSEPWEGLYIRDGMGAVMAVNKLYRKVLFKGLRYPVGKLHEDEFLTYKLLHRAGVVAFVPAPLYAIYPNPKSITQSKFSLGRLEVLDALAERVAYCHANGLSALEAWAVRDYFSRCIDYSRRLAEADWIPASVRKREAARIRKRARTILVRYGIRGLSPRADYNCYSFAFPRLMRGVRAPFVAMNHLRRGTSR